MSDDKKQSLKSTLLIGCRLPHGMTLELPDGKTKVKIEGLNQIIIKGVDYKTTEVNADLWNAWKAANPDSKPLKSGAIFEASTEREAAAKAAELSQEETGLKPVNPKKHGVKDANKDD